jgi:hypothetical protein
MLSVMCITAKVVERSWWGVRTARRSVPQRMRLSVLAFVFDYIHNSLTSRGVKSGSVVNMTARSRRGRVKLLGVAIDVVLT